MQNLLTGYYDCRQFVTQPPPLLPPLPVNNNPQTLFGSAAFIFSMSGSLASAPSTCSAHRSLPRGVKYKPWVRRSAQRPLGLPHIQSSLASPVQMHILNGGEESTHLKTPSSISLKILFLSSNCGRVLLSSLLQPNVQQDHLVVRAGGVQGQALPQLCQGWSYLSQSC